MNAWLSVAAALALPTADTHSPVERPVRGVVLIVTDDQGYGDFGFQGNPVLETPHLDRLAREGVFATAFYVHPVCAPTRAALFTGRHPYRTRVVDTYIGRAMMDPDEVTLAEALRGAGFATGIFGKWHLGDCHPMRPIDQGFDRALVHRGGGIGQPSDPPGGEGRYTDPVLLNDGEPEQRFGYCTRVYFDAARAFIRAEHARGRRFFAAITTNAPHGPFHDVPEGWRSFYAARDLSKRAFPDTGHPLPDTDDEDRLARIYAMIRDIDENLGRLLAELETLGILDDTLVVFLTDNGPNTRRYTAGLRGMKGEVFEGGVRSPLLVRLPGHLPAGRTISAPCSAIDVMPTVLDACGVPLPGKARIDGRSLLPLLQGARTDPEWLDRPIVVQAHRGDVPRRLHNFMLRRGRYKLLHPSGFREPRRDEAFDAPRLLLFDLQEDPFEQHDLAASRPELVAELLALYDAWFDEVCSTSEDDFAPPRIAIGADAEIRTTLTRQDWRRTSADGGWNRRSTGHWEVVVERDGPYAFEVRFPKGTAPEGCDISSGDVSLAFDVVPGANSSCTTLFLRQGPQRLEVLLRDEEGIFGPHQVVVRRL